YALVLAPALRELLPRSGFAATGENIGYYGSVLFALFLIGWGLSMIWGPVADRFGRVRTLMLTILCYSLFTFLGALVTNVWQLAACRLLAGIGIGGEWSMGGTFVAEEWPEDRRKMGAGYMHTGYYFGFFLAAIANYSIGATYGWRWMFLLGGTPALLVTFIRYGVHASAARLASYGTMVLSAGTILGCLVLPPLAESMGRRLTLGLYFLVMFFSIAIGFGYVFYLGSHALRWFFTVLFFLGFGGANFAMYTLWLPEQYSTECRASAFAFATSVGRFAGAGIT